MKAVIVGLGYVGLPLAQAASDSGLEILGLDLNSRIVEGLNSGRSHIDDVSDLNVRQMIKQGFTATSNPLVISEADIVVMCVPTPLDEAGSPDLTAVINATQTIAENCKIGATVVLESTTYPGTTQEILKPILEAEGKICGIDFYLAFSPERIDPGNKEYGIKNTPKVVGGVTESCTIRAATFYEHFIDTVVTARSPREAETTKLLENTYRHVNIALVNEMAQFCHAMGIDIWNVIELARSKPFGFQSFTPSAGVGGHCIPIDPNYLAYKVRSDLNRPFRFVELAEEINQSMPVFVSQRIQSLLNDDYRSARGAQVLMLGVTYKPNISDRRESPAVPLAKRLLDLGCELRYHDPFVDKWAVNDIAIDRANNLEEACRSADAIVIVQAHNQYLEAPAPITASGTTTLDTTGKFVGSHVHRL